MKQLISLPDFSGYAAITPNLDSANRLDPLILQSQKYDLRGLLGDAMFWDLMNNIPERITQLPFEIGKQYYIQEYKTGDDFTNIGGENEGSTVFTATGTAPSGWDAQSVVFEYTKYSKLMLGCDYIITGSSPEITITFEGIKPALIHWTMARFYSHNNTTITNYGIVQKKTQDSEAISDKKESQLVGQERAMAEADGENIIKFLDNNRSDFPLWKSSICKKPAGSNKVRSIDPYDHPDYPNHLPHY